MSIGNRVALGFGLSLLVLLVLAGVAFQGANQLTESTQGLLTTHGNVRAIQNVRAQLVDAESSQRGFLLTGEEPYLVPHQRAITALKQDLAQLRDTVATDSQQRARLSRLEPIVAERLERLAEGIRVRRAQGLEAGSKYIQVGQGERLMNDVRELSAEMLAAEQQRWEDHSSEARVMAQRLLWVLSICAVTGLVILGVGSVLVTRSITVPLHKLMVGAEQLGRGQLDHRIDVRGSDEAAELARAFNEMAERRRQTETQLAKQSEQREHTLRTVADFVSQLAGASSEILASTTEQVASAQVGSSRVDLQACKLEYSIVSPK